VAASSGARLSFDPSSVGVIKRFGAAVLLDAIERNGVDLVLPNAAEAQALASAVEIREAAYLLNERVSTVIVKLGAEGALVAEKSNVRDVCAIPVAPLDTTGAGDAFNAGVLAGLQMGSSVDDACREGHRVAGQVVLKYGGTPNS
jgi:sugar/nucleoside kinase (ribokinase family)